jgi:hypothetical protein
LKVYNIYIRKKEEIMRKEVKVSRVSNVVSLLASQDLLNFDLQVRNRVYSFTFLKEGKIIGEMIINSDGNTTITINSSEFEVFLRYIEKYTFESLI